MGPSRPAPAHLLQTTGPRPPVFVQLPASALPGAIAAFPLRRMFKGAWKLLSTPLLSHRPAWGKRQGSAVYGFLRNGQKKRTIEIFSCSFVPLLRSRYSESIFSNSLVSDELKLQRRYDDENPFKGQRSGPVFRRDQKFKSRAHRFRRYGKTSPHPPLPFTWFGG